VKRIQENISQETVEVHKGYRDRIDMLRSRVNLLGGKDKLLMKMYLENGNSFRQMARLAGVNETCIARRIYKVTERLLNGEYITCLRNRDKFSRDEMDIAKDYFLLGLSMRKISAKRHCSYYRVRETLKRFQELIKIGDRG